jgi:hypothetical protein
MKSIRKSKTCLVLFLILSFTVTALASPGKYAQLEKGDRLPWDGWCFDGHAMAEIMADKELAEQRCELKTLQALEEQKAQFDLQIGQLQSAMDYEVKTKETTIQALKKENLELEEVIIHNNKFGWVGPSAIGFIVGGLTIFLLTL